MIIWSIPSPPSNQASSHSGVFLFAMVVGALYQPYRHSICQYPWEHMHVLPQDWQRKGLFDACNYSTKCSTHTSIREKNHSKKPLMHIRTQVHVIFACSMRLKFAESFWESAGYGSDVHKQQPLFLQRWHVSFWGYTTTSACSHRPYFCLYITNTHTRGQIACRCL